MSDGPCKCLKLIALSLATLQPLRAWAPLRARTARSGLTEDSHRQPFLTGNPAWSHVSGSAGSERGFRSRSARPGLKAPTTSPAARQTRPFFSVCFSSSVSNTAWGTLKLVCRSRSTACANFARPRCAARSRMPSVPVTRRPFR